MSGARPAPSLVRVPRASWTDAILRHLRSGLTRSEAIHLAGTTRSAFYAHLRRSPEFRQAVLDAESSVPRRFGFRASPPPQRLVHARATAGGAMAVVWLSVVVVPLLVGLMLLALGAQPGQVHLTW